MSTIAFIGLGSMGAGMARNLAAAGHQLRVFNRSVEKSEPLRKMGAFVASSPADAVDGANFIFTMVTNDDASRSVWLADNGVLAGKAAQGAIAIECSTVSRSWLLTLAGEVAKRGLRFLDCPVAGRPDAAEAAQLSVFTGGADKDFADARPVLALMARSVRHFGPVGAGISFKLIYNTLGAVQIAALAEAMAACSACGIDLNVAADAFGSGATGSPHVIRHSKAMATKGYDRPVQFTPAGRVKDLEYGFALAASLGASSTHGLTARSLYQRMIDGGQADRNDAELFEFLMGR